MGIFGFLKQLSLRYRKVLVLAFVIWGLGTFGLGFFSGWFFTKGGLGKFPEIYSSDRVLILAPHVDDEAIGAGGIILESLSKKAKVKVVYLTNGDDYWLTYFKEKKKLDLNPEGFVRIVEERMEEGRQAMGVLGLGEKDLIFLGYPDQGLTLMLSKSYSTLTPVVAKGTKIDHNPYPGTYKPGRVYSGENLVYDLGEIIDEFAPTKIFVSHPRDYHPDHRAAFHFLKRVLEEKNLSVSVYSYLIHYPLFPPKETFGKTSLLYPPKKLFSPKGWVSFELSGDQVNKKEEAIKKYKSQLGKPDNLLLSFVRRNEIFEETEIVGGREFWPEETKAESDLMVTATPTPTALPTATPTLSPAQVLSSMSQKYGPCRALPILMYHHLLETKAAKEILAESLNVPPEIFEKQLIYLKQKGYQSLFLTELMEGLKNGTLPPKPVVLSFDDGYKELYENLLPKLKSYNFKADVFVISQFVGGERYLSWEELAEMEKSGLIEIGDHTLSHLSLALMDKEKQFDQIVSAKKIIEERLGKEILVFAYPYGSFNEISEKILKENGFVAAVKNGGGGVVCFGLPYEIPRIRVGATSLDKYGI